jgi:hypothetical protein
MDGENSNFKFQISRKREASRKRSGREKRGQDVPTTDWDCKSQPRDAFWREKRGQDVPATDWDYKSQLRDAFFSSAACHGVRVA